MKDYSAIEQRLQENYDGLLSAVRAPEIRINKNAKISRREVISEFFGRPGMQIAAAALALVFTVGGVYGFIFYFSGKGFNNNHNPPVTAADTQTETEEETTAEETTKETTKEITKETTENTTEEITEEMTEEATEETIKETAEETAEETTEETTEEITERQTTSEQTTEEETEKEEKSGEFKSVQPRHDTPETVDRPSPASSSNPEYVIYEDEIDHNFKSVYVVFRLVDYGYFQFEDLMSRHGTKLPEKTAELINKIGEGKLKLWLCDLHGNKIDYVYANKYGCAGFTVCPGEYKVIYEDDGTYKTDYSTTVKVMQNPDGGGFAYYKLYNDDGSIASGEYATVYIYDYQRYKPVTITVKDGDTGEPLENVRIDYQTQYLREGWDYMQTDKNGTLKLGSIFELIMYRERSFVTSWHDDIMLTFEKDGYEPLSIETDNVTQTVFEVSLYKKT